MKRFVCTDSSDAFVSFTSSKEEQPSCSNIHGYSKKFQAMLESLEQEDYSEDGGPIPERKRRLRLDQVKALERYFEVENKLEPERKMKIAAELDLEPRQVTIWFQNRRARWKTKQLEREYGVLRVNYDALKLDYDVLERENASLSSKLRELREKEKQSNNTVSEYTPVLEFCRKSEEAEIKIQRNLIDGSSESDSNGVVNDAGEGNSGFHLSKAGDISSRIYENQSEIMKTTEELSLFSAEEPCNFCSVDQAPSLHW